MWSQGYRFPSLNQMFLGTSMGQMGTTYPDPDLDPEKSNSFEIGARITRPNWTVDVATFYTDSRNYITTRKIPGTDNSIYTNIDKARTWGAELGGEYTLKNLWNITPHASVTYLYRKYENTVDHLTDGQVTHKTSRTGTPPLQGIVGLKWEKDMAEKLVLFTDAYAHWATKAKTETYDNEFKGRYVTEEDGGWTTLNLTAGLQGTGDIKWHTTLSLRNLLNKTYRQATNGVNDPGFHAVITAGVEF